MTIAFIALGANKTAWFEGKALSPRAAVPKALAALDSLQSCYVVAASGLYITHPIGPGRQRPYVNAVAAIETDLDLGSFLDVLHSTENTFRRQRKRAWQARSLDLDVLDFGGVIAPSQGAWRRALHRPWPNRLALRSPFLRSAHAPVVPHVRLHQRGFVLFPLLELCPNWLHPVFQKTVTHLVRAVDRRSVKRVASITL